jgi:tetratricopeptide (TPR) repeat protein
LDINLDTREFTNHYEVLGVPEYASNAQVKTSYLAISRILERNLDQRRVTINGLAVTPEQVFVAYRTLTNPEKRAWFDVALQQQRAHPTIGEDGAMTVKPVELLSYTERMYWEAVERVQDRDYEQALICLSKLRKFERDHPLILRLIATVHLVTGAPEFGVPLAQQACELEPENEENFLVLGRLHEAMRKFRAARTCYQNAHQINPENLTVREQFERGSLVFEQVRRGIVWFVKCFLPDRNARSFRYQEGVITIHHMIKFVRCTIRRMSPQPNDLTFRYTGVC